MYYFTAPNCTRHWHQQNLCRWCQQCSRETAKSRQARRQKRYTVFSDEKRGQIGRYATENRNIAALKKFRHNIAKLRESTVPQSRCYIHLGVIEVLFQSTLGQVRPREDRLVLTLKIEMFIHVQYMHVM